MMKIPRTEKYRLTRSLFTSRAARRRTIGWLILLGGILLGGTIVLDQAFPWLTEPAALKTRLETAGPYAPAVFVLIQAAQVIIAPIPGQALAFMSGYLFGTIPGTVYSLLGATLGSYVVFRLSRRYGRRHVERAIDSTLIDRFDTIIASRGLPALFVVFLVPGLPDDVICFLAGLSDLRIRDMLVVSVAGRFPGYLVANAAGAQLQAGNELVTGVLVIGAFIIAVIGYYSREGILQWLSGRST